MLAKRLFVYFFMFFSLCLVCYLFYAEDIKNRLPTAIPKKYVATKFGAKYDNNFVIKLSKKMKLLHFFNPECPCSKFNIKHIKNLATQYQQQVEFVAYSSSKDFPKDYPIPILHDKNGKMAALYGVYSTPQAVLLHTNGKMLYRGNDNVSRYCGSKNTEYVAIAIEKELKNQSSPSTMLLASKPYGCPIDLPEK